MRVISGKYRGKKLISPADSSVRPTTDRIKETVFNILQARVPDARVLDLFAGSGALGIECISRGAREVVFVDSSRTSVELVRQNLKGIEGGFRVVQADFAAAIRTEKEPFDIVFVDAPYGSGLGEAAVYAVLDRGLLAADGVIAYEHSVNLPFRPERDDVVTREKIMGTVTVDFVRRKSRALVTGSFDPVTVAHVAIVEEALRQFDEVTVACLVNPDKEYMFTPEERVALAEAAFADEPRVRVLFSEDAAVDVAKRENAQALVRGLRGGEMSDYEEEMAKYNGAHGVETCFVSPDVASEVSSTAARKALQSGDFRIVPNRAIIELKKILEHKKTKGDVHA